MPVPSTSRRGSQEPTKAGMAGCATATPIPITTVAANRLIASKARRRGAEPSAVNSKPAVRAAITPMRATSREPASDAAAKITIGAPLSAAISVPVRPNSLRSAGNAGGTARIARRSAMPISQRRASESGQERGDVTEDSRGRIIALSGGSLQAPKRLLELLFAGLSLVAFLPPALDNLHRRALAKIGVVEFLIDAGDVGVALGDFFGQSCALGIEVERIRHRKRNSAFSNWRLNNKRGNWHRTGRRARHRQIFNSTCLGVPRSYGHAVNLNCRVSKARDACGI